MTDEHDAADGGGRDDDVPRRPALDVPPLAAWWVIAGGIVVGLRFVLTDHVLRATAVSGGPMRIVPDGSPAAESSVSRPSAEAVTTRSRLATRSLIVASPNSLRATSLL